MRALAVQRPSRPVLLLLAVCAVSLGARAAWLGAPCHAPCRSASDHVLIFDERYYVNAARVIAGIRPAPGAPYADAPLGVDPNAEHPQLVKLVIAGSIELFGDGPLAWRLGSLVAGTLAILGMFALVRATGAGQWPALAAAALLAADNLMIVHGRIGTLDIYAVAAMLWGVALYLRRQPLLAGIVIALAAATKLFGAYALIVLAIYELVVWLRGGGRPTRPIARLAACSAVAAGVFVGLLASLDAIAAPYDDAGRRFVGGGPLGHLGHMISYGAGQSSPGGPQGIASYPWGWLVDYKSIVYLNVNPARPAPGLYHLHPAVHFLGLISPPILLVGLPALALAAIGLTGRWIGLPAPSAWSSAGDRLAAVAASWFVGSFAPFVLLSVIFNRTSYLYYMVVVMPGFYAAVAFALPWLRRWPRWTTLWIASVVAAAVITYPLTPLP
jgi:4-amino-4-deoxy-L-arabinose transferase-like glycosyltransferase